MDPTTLDRLPRPGPLGVVLGTARVLAVVALLIGGTVVLLAAALVPVRVRGIRPAVHVAVGIARLFIAITGIALHVDGRDALRAHRGFLFFNHLAWLDPIVSRRRNGRVSRRRLAWRGGGGLLVAKWWLHWICPVLRRRSSTVIRCRRATR